MSSGWLVLEGQQWGLVRIQEGGAELVTTNSEPAASGEGAASTLATALVKAGYRGEDVIVGLSAQSCFCGSIPTDSVAGVQTRQESTYELETALPFSAEEIVADFIQRDDLTLGIAIEKQRWLDAVRELQESGIAIRSITPTSVLAAQELTSRHAELPSDSDGTELLLGESDGAVDAVTLVDGEPVDWTHLALDAIQQHVAYVRFRFGEIGRVQLAGSTSAIAWPEFNEEADTEQLDESMHDLASAAAVKILQGDSNAQIEFRRDELADSNRWRPLAREFRLLAVSLIVFLVVAVGSLLWKAREFDALAQRFHGQQQDVFRELFPGQPVPLAIPSRLRSELRQSTGLHVQTDTVPEVESALGTLEATLKGMPEGLRYRISEVDIDGRRVGISGEVKTHGDGARLGSSFREAGFDLQTPRTVQTSTGTVSVRISGELASNDSETPGRRQEGVE